MAATTTIYLVRHGKALPSSPTDNDPPLDKPGLKQALAMADILGPKGPLDLVVSPIRRTRETAAALEHVWGAPGRIEPRVTEVPSNTPDLDSRRAWLQEFMSGTWEDRLAQDVIGWRAGVMQAIEELQEDTVVVSHFVAINTIVGLLTGDNRVTVFKPDNCSITRLERRDGMLVIAERGREMETEIF